MDVQFCSSVYLTKINYNGFGISEEKLINVFAVDNLELRDAFFENFVYNKDTF